MGSAKLLDFYKTMINEENRLNKVKQEIKSMAEKQQNAIDSREQALRIREEGLIEMRARLNAEINEVVD